MGVWMWLVLAWGLCSLAGANLDGGEFVVLSEVSLEKSLEMVRSIPAHFYFDVGKGHYRVGIFGDSVASTHPEFVQMVDKAVLKGVSGLSDTATVDTALVFTHAMAASQLLAQQLSALESSSASLPGRSPLPPPDLDLADMQDNLKRIDQRLSVMKDKPKDLTGTFETIKLRQDLQRLLVKTLETEGAAKVKVLKFLEKERIAHYYQHHQLLSNLSSKSSQGENMLGVSHADPSLLSDTDQELLSEFDYQKSLLQAEYELDIGLIKERHAEAARMERLNEPTTQRLFETESKLAQSETSQLVDTVFSELDALYKGIFKSKETMFKLGAAIFGFLVFLGAALELVPALRSLWVSFTRKGVLQFQRPKVGLFSRRSTSSTEMLDNMTLSTDLRRALAELSCNLRSAAQLKTKLPFVLFHGDPGTGKTLAAKSVAMDSGLPHAILCAADLQVMGMKAGLYLRQLLDVAERQGEPCVLIIDEADSIITCRAELASSKSLASSCLYALLQTMREGSTNLSVIITTRRTLSGVDLAMLNRIDRVVSFAIPDAQLRLNFALTQIPVKLGMYIPSQILQDFGSIYGASDAIVGQFNLLVASLWGSESSVQQQVSSPETDRPSHTSSATEIAHLFQVQEILRQALLEEEQAPLSPERALGHYLLASSLWSYRDLDKFINGVALKATTTEKCGAYEWNLVLLAKVKETASLQNG